MAAIYYPGAEPRLLAGKSTTPLSPRVINVHTMVWFLTACEDYFALSGKPYSHFGTEGDGRCVQWQDLQYRAASDLNGNPFCISIENSDKGTYFPTWSGSDVPRFTDPQAATLVQLIAWLCVRFDIPAVLLNDSLPDRVGPSYHRLGIDPWRVDGGVLYSSAYGKVCPGDRRIAQLRDEILPAVQALLAKPPPPASQEDHPMRLVNCPGRTTVNDPDGNPVDVADRWYWLTPDGKRFWVSEPVFAKQIVDDHEKGGAKVYYAGRGTVGTVTNSPLPLDFSAVSLDNLYAPLRPGTDY